MRAVHIRWHDAHHIGAGEWGNADTIPGVEVVTVGLYLGKRNGYHVVAHTMQQDGTVTGVFAIPVSSVIGKIRTIAK